MTDTEDIHEVFRQRESFEELLVDIKDERRIFELLVSVEGVGRELDTEAEVGKVSERDLGWVRLLWEAHHEQEATKELVNP